MRELEGVALEREVSDRVMGWKLADYDSPDDFTELPCFHTFGYADGDAVVVYREGSKSGKGWSPLTNIADAYETVATMNALGWMLETRQNGAMETIAQFLRYEEESPWYAPEGVSKNPGEAICRAALLAVEVGTNAI